MNDLKDTVDLMLSDDPKDRLRAEYHQAKIRIVKLWRYLLDGPLTEDSQEYQMLKKQAGIMMDYIKVLAWRAGYMGIDLFADEEHFNV